ncbi:MAG: DUF3606 domain-containing protein [Bacteroidetes bacterium]|nr:DUF3606 domain-containing protein [Bacteroidota bacterium]
MNEQNFLTPTDDWNLNLKDAWQVLCWCNILGVTKAQLERAVDTVGSAIMDIEVHFSRPYARV